MWHVKIVGLLVFFIAMICICGAQQNFGQGANLNNPLQRQPLNSFYQRQQPLQPQPNRQRVNQGQPSVSPNQQQQFNQGPYWKQSRPQRQGRPSQPNSTLNGRGKPESVLDIPERECDKDQFWDPWTKTCRPRL